MTDCSSFALLLELKGIADAILVSSLPASAVQRSHCLKQSDGKKLHRINLFGGFFYRQNVLGPAVPQSSDQGRLTRPITTAVAATHVTRKLKM